MKRSLKLREAHKGNGSPALCSIQWGISGCDLVTASASDPCILIHDASQPSKPAKELRHHKDGVTALAVSPGSPSLASGSIDHSVKIYNLPDGEFESNITRFTLPIRSLAFSNKGSLLAAAGDDDGIKLIATIDSSISRVLKGHKGPVSSISFDPSNEYLASVDTLGTVIFWELSSGKQVHILKAIAPNCDADASLINVISWSPNGETLAVPGLKNDVVMYDRDTAEKMFTLKGDHERPVCFLAWSPNGKYMATSGLDMQVLIWDVDLRQDIERQKFDDRVCSLAWKENGNALAVIDVMGKFGVWESVVPSCMKSPTDGAAQTRDKGGLLLFDEDDENPSTSGSLDDTVEESHGESVLISRKRLRKQSISDEISDRDSDGEEGLLRQIELRKRHTSKHKKRTIDEKEENSSYLNSTRPKMQEAFQPGFTPAQAGKRHFLAYNMLGSITTIENEGYSHIEVDFHDTGRGPRVPAMTDYFGFTMAALSESGSVFSNPCKGEKNMSTLMYRPFGSWANNSEWSMRFEGEEVKAVALGTGWVAAITSLNFLRIFTEGGLQKHIICLNGPVVTAAGYKDTLSIVTHASECLHSGDQMLQVRVLKISDGTELINCHLPLSPTSILTWFGFSEEGQLSSYDSKGVLRVFSHQYGGSWLPVFSAHKTRKSDDENYWIVGLNANKLFCIICKSPDSYPMVVTPKPVLEILSLSIPVASSDLGAADLESELIMNRLHLSQIQKNIEESAMSGLDTSALDDEAFDIEAAMDRCILRLIASCCNGDKLVRATELARSLSLEKSLRGAIKLATALKLPILAERFNTILEERLFNGSTISAAIPYAASNSVISKMPVHKVALAPDVSGINPSTSSPSPGLVHFSKQETTEEKLKAVKGKESCKGTTSSNEGAKLDISQIRCHQTKATSNVVSHEASGKWGSDVDTCKKDSENNTIGGNLGEGANLRPSHRPINPFAKTASNQEKSSLLESIRRMKKADNEKDDKLSNKKIKTQKH
ncbi:WD repeat and HMG-box DNA-binding protein 1 [Canna indica]|uniref:WD repeat and HMG-box DNA-binding protein 1 n=1 Tax=Canna indica TaxID=4628 RepID=A0AAQ3JSR2_9LILI|nr:WD repeat and HMG-box DNA-binding protein 1 [Canna indica]